MVTATEPLRRYVAAEMRGACLRALGVVVARDIIEAAHVAADGFGERVGVVPWFACSKQLRRRAEEASR